MLQYQLAVRRYDNGDPFVRGLTLGKPAKRGLGGTTGMLKTCTFPLRNTGAAGAAPFDQDVYRVSATSSSADWKLTLPNALAAAKAGGPAVKVDVHAVRASRRHQDDHDADGHVGERPLEDGHADVRPRGLSPEVEERRRHGAGPERAPLSV